MEFDIEKDLHLNDEYERRVVIDVTIEEFPTGRRQNNSVEVYIHKYDYNMNIIKTADYFKPGLTYIAYVSKINFSFYWTILYNFVLLRLKCPIMMEHH